MSKWRLTSLVDLASQAVVAARYVVVLALLSAAVVYGSDRLLQSTLHSFDPVVMSLPIDDAVVHNHRVQSTANARAGEARESTEDVVFDHARPSPRLFERVSAVEAEKIKASVRETVVAEGAEDWYHGSGGTYRTVCVRLCDSAYFPVSFSTTRNWFNRDEAVCKSRCGAPARLYVAPNPGGSPETMRDRNGASYIALPTAFQFRKGTVSGCSCRAEAWEAASIERHRGYEIAAASAAAPVAASDSVRVADGVAPNVTQNVAHDASEGRLRVAVAGWTSTGDATTGSLVVDEVAAEAAQIPPVEPTPAGAGKAPPSAPVARLAKLDVDQQASRDVAPYRPQTMTAPPATAAATPVTPIPVTAPQRLVPVERALKAVPPQVVVKARPVKTAKRSAGGKRRPVPQQDEVVTETVNIAVQSAMDTPAPRKAAQTWGVGPNSRSAPRGNTAFEVFARNFY